MINTQHGGSTRRKKKSFHFFFPKNYLSTDFFLPFYRLERWNEMKLLPNISTGTNILLRIVERIYSDIWRGERKKEDIIQVKVIRKKEKRGSKAEFAMPWGIN
jgi:hypothetical protein